MPANDPAVRSSQKRRPATILTQEFDPFLQSQTRKCPLPLSTRHMNVKHPRFLMTPNSTSCSFKRPSKNSNLDNEVLAPLTTSSYILLAMGAGSSDESEISPNFKKILLLKISPILSISALTGNHLLKLTNDE
ncbi:hypothetical protein CEXT_135221 [Caerostris extrusa]|uniref:Uncharacterized protein n=1 Tax=Caerostris extrusa TaxID=172846 RepID=A0AAV4P2C1_CAEEX|nr:hypothetical protein CEXT_135221 [Caerostris extrusa]